MPSDFSTPASGHEATANQDECASSEANAAPVSLRDGGTAALAEFHQSTGRTVHMLNNLLTALYCQWDVCFPEPSDDPDDSAPLLRRTVDLMATEIRTLSRACADYAPAADAVRQAAKGAPKDIRRGNMTTDSRN